MESTKDCNQSLKTSSLIKHDVKLEPELINEINETYNMDNIYYDDEIPVEDECLEIEDTVEDKDDFCFKLEPAIDRLISPIPVTEYDDDLKSPLNTISDCGYESQGSPMSLHEFSPLNNTVDDLNYLLNDLFPSLA